MPPALPVTMNLTAAGRTFGLSRTKMYELIEEGRIRRLDIGPRNVRVYTADLEAYLADCVTNS